MVKRHGNRKLKSTPDPPHANARRFVAPISILASVNGLDVAGKKYLLRLDQGDFDVAAYLKKLFAAGYQGPVGLQCFSVPGDTLENLKADMAAWKKLSAKLAGP